MKKYCKAVINLVIALISVVFLVPKILVFFAPFLAGWIVALIAGPLVRFFEEKLRIKRKAGSAVVIVLVIGLVILMIYLLGGKLIREGVGLVNALPEIWESTEADLIDIADNLNVIYKRLPADVQAKLSEIGNDMVAYLSGMVGNISMPTIVAVGNFAKQLPALLIACIMTLLSSYLFIAERDNIIAWYRNVTPKAIRDRVQIVRRSLMKAVGGYLKAQLRIEIWMYLLLVVGLSILRIDYVLLIAFLIAFLDFIPFFGTGTILVPWALIKFLSGDYKIAIGLLIIWGVGQLARQIIQPKIVGDSIGVAPIPTLFLLYIGFRLGGVFGMIVSVPIGLILFTMYEEGVFDTTKNSIRILVNGLNRFRRLEKEDLKDLDKEDPHA